MSVIDLEPRPISQPLDRPERGFVTPGQEQIEEEQQRPRPGVGSLIGATFRTENLIGSAVTQDLQGRGEDDPDFRPFDEIKGTQYEEHWPAFIDVRNQRQFFATMRQIDRERADRKIIDAAPWWMSVPASLAANLADPTILIPGGAFVRGAKGGFAISRSAFNVGASAAGATAMQEAGLHSTQHLRTLGESGLNIGASAFLGGLIGAAGARLMTSAEWRSSTRAIEDELASLERALAGAPDAPAPGSVGAAAVGTHSIGEMSIAGTAASGVAATTRRLNPGLRLTQSKNPATRDVAFNLFETSQYIRGNQDGLATPIAAETLRKEWDAGLMQAIAELRSAYSDYRRGGGRLSRIEFQEAVGKAQRRNDEHAIPEVARAAKAARAELINPLRDAAIAAKIIPEGVSVETAPSYFSRLWNRRRLIAEEGEFKRVVMEWANSNAPRWLREFDQETERQAAKIADGAKRRDFINERRVEQDAQFGATTGDFARGIADEVFDKLTGRAAAQSGTRPEFITINARGPLKERTFNIPDELVERWLEHDAEMVWRRYQRIMSADVELANKFGTPDMKDALQKVRDGYNKLRAGETDERRLTKLADAEKADLRDLEGVRDIIRGNFSQSLWERDFGTIVRVANAAQYILKMGGVVLSSLTEPVRVVAAKGLLPFMQTGFAALGNLQAIKLSIREAQLAGNVHDKLLAARLYTMADLGDFYSSRGKIEKFMDNLTNVASTWNGIRLWTDGVKSLASTMIQNQVIEAAVGFASGSKGARYLAHLGIDQSMAGRIAKQFEEHGQTLNGVRVAGTEAWTDEVARRAYRAALNKDLDSMVVTRGASDLPLFANTPLGRLLFQFNTFNLASHQRILMRGLQEGHARLLGTVVALTSMGMLQTYLAAAFGNRLDKLPRFEENPGWWIAEGLDRSGVFQVFFQVSNAMEKLTGINPIKAPLKAGDVGNAQSDRMRNRNELGAVFGPTATTIQDIGSVAGIAKNLVTGQDITKGQMNAAERLIPFNSYLGVRQFLKYFVNPPND